ncbi:MAG: PIG-L family deacetylase [Nanoarchaeota archaeon]
MKKALVIVAHPDDETIWMGGTILQNPDWNWTIFSLCRADDPDRAPKFKEVCKRLKAKSIITDLDDESDEPLSSDGMKEAILENLEETIYDLIFTHGANGEYGHIRHVGVHEAVTELVQEKKLKCNKLWYFDYIPGTEISPHDNKTIIPIPNKKADWIVKLTEKEYQGKLRVITKIYGYIPPIFETMACAREEAFSQHN